MPFEPPIVPLPEIPPQPPVAVPDAASDPHAFNAWLAAWTNYRWCVQQHADAACRALKAEFHGELLAAVDSAAGAVMQALATRALPTRDGLIFEMVKSQPQATVLTPAVVVKGATEIVDAYIAKSPGAVRAE